MKMPPTMMERKPVCQSRHSEGPALTAEAPSLEIAEVFRAHGAAYVRDHPVTFEQARAVRDIVRCRTAQMGGHLEVCDRCGFERPHYNSCRNRNCNKCGTLAKEQWIEAREAEVLPTEYFHAVVTCPHEFNGLSMHNRRTFYDVFFKAVAETFLKFGRDELEGTLGLTTILHTWDQRLNTHLHLHCLIPHGALSFDGKRWNRPKSKRYLFDVKEVSEAFKERFSRMLKSAFEKGTIEWDDQGKGAASFDEMVDQVGEKPWVVYLQPPVAGPDAVIDYLARYTHRVAFGNHRLTEIREDAVTFTWYDRDTREKREETLEPEEFIRRYLNHVVPHRFYRIRHYGLYANRNKKRLLRQAMLALGYFPEIESPEPKTPEQWFYIMTGEDVTVCPECGEGRMQKTSVARKKTTGLLSPAGTDASRSASSAS